jgi:hypothetical protein
MKKNSEIQKKLELKFLQLLDQSEADPAVKKEVFHSISQIEAAAELIDLFTVKMIQTEASILESHFFEEEE